MKELKSIIKVERTKIYVAMGVSIFFPLVFTVFSILVSLALLILVLAYIAVMYPVFKKYFETLKLYERILTYTPTDPKKALKYLESDIYDLDSVLNVQKTEMDVHSFKATNEAKAMRASRANEAGVRRKLGLYKRMQVILNAIIKDKPTEPSDAWDV